MSFSNSVSFHSNKTNYKNNGRLVSVSDLITIRGNTIIKQNVNKIVNFMNDGGLIPPIWVDKDTNIVIDGNHRLYATIENNKQRIRAIFL